RVIGMVYRETGRTVLAESRLRSAIGLAVAAGAVLGEAEASRELALLYQAMGRNQEALRLLNTASRLFQRMDARVDQVHVGGKLAELKGVYLDVVRAWGESIESGDSYTFGIASGWRGARWRWHGRWRSTTRTRRPSSWALTSTTWASCGSRTSCFASRGRSRARSARWCRCIRSGGSSCWRASSSPGT